MENPNATATQGDPDQTHLDRALSISVQLGEERAIDIAKSGLGYKAGLWTGLPVGFLIGTVITTIIAWLW